MPNLPRVMLRAPLRVVAWMLLLLVGLAAPDVAPLADGVGSHDPPTRTAKERLRFSDWTTGQRQGAGLYQLYREDSHDQGHEPRQREESQHEGVGAARR
jgi:hypothetical protein